MNKLLAIIKREYVQGVRSKTFLVSTILGPLMMVVFTVVPGLLMTLKTGGATRIAVVDETGRLYEGVRESIMRGGDAEATKNIEENMPAGMNVKPGARQMPPAEMMGLRYRIEEAKLEGRSLPEVQKALDERVLREELDAYLILPPDIIESKSRARYYGRNTGDVMTVGALEDRLSRAVIEQRMRDANIAPERVRELNRDVRMTKNKVSKEGTREESGLGSFGLALGVGIFVLIAVLMYGQAILSAVVEEKTTRIVEVLFSSTKAFTLMAGKLIGVSLVALTQYMIWAMLIGALAIYGVGMLAASGVNFTMPSVPTLFVVYALLYFLLGFYIYATLYAVVGAIVTTEKEAGQIIIPVSFLMVIGIYLSFPVIRSPNSAFSFWISMIPFFSPITMLVRIVTETPPFWQIALSLVIGFATVAGIVWVAARIYRTGMLMYGKRATIPEVWRWMRQS